MTTEANGYVFITADTYEEAGQAAEEFEILAGWRFEQQTIDYDLAVQAAATITNSRSSAEARVEWDSGPLSVVLSADTEGRRSIMVGFKIRFGG